MEWSDVVIAAVSVLVGTILSLYFTVVFSRFVRYGELIRELARERQHFEGYPSSLNSLEHSYPKAVAFWRNAERIEWSLNSDGHYKAGGQVGRVRQWAYWIAAKQEEIIRAYDDKAQQSLLLQSFQGYYHQNLEKFRQFELNIQCSVIALLQPWPHQVMPKKSETILDNFEESTGPKVKLPDDLSDAP